MNNRLKHVVLIPDGNRRWGRERKVSVADAYERGAKAIETFLKLCLEYHVRVCTVWGFSTENWRRDDKEIQDVMGLMEELLNGYEDFFFQKKIQIVHVGRKDRIKPNFPGLWDVICRLEKGTKAFKKAVLNVAIDYGGRDEIVRAIKKLFKHAPASEDITSELFAQYLDTAGNPDPDVIIRTSGVHRLSGIYPFQADYAEIVFCNEHLADLGRSKIAAIFDKFSQVDRRFGGMSREK